MLDATSPFKIDVEYSEHVMAGLQDAVLQGDSAAVANFVATETAEIRRLLIAVEKMVAENTKGDTYKKTLLNAARTIETASAAHVQLAKLLLENPEDEVCTPGIVIHRISNYKFRCRAPLSVCKILLET